MGLIPYLHSSLGEVGLHRDLLPGVDVGVVGLGEGLLQLLQLGAGEGCTYPPLLPLLGADRGVVAVLVHFVGKTCGQQKRFQGSFESGYCRR